jgi:phosphoribosylanthranilate isomerase
MQIKLCGFSEPETLKTAIAFGCNFIGIVFVKNSIRYVDPRASKILSELIPTHIYKVAVVADETLENLEIINQNFQPHFFQLHGNENIEYIKTLTKKFPNIAIIKAIAVSMPNDLEKIKIFNDHVNYFLLDNKNPGSGNSFDWNFLKDFQSSKPYFLSGGINIFNIDEAIRITNPDLIDISSGIEIQKGIKSSKLIIEILQKIKAINESDYNKN